VTWASIALLLLQIADKLLDFTRQKQSMDAGADRQIAQTSAAILAKTEFAKQTKEKIDALRGSDLDVLLTELAKPN